MRRTVETGLIIFFVCAKLLRLLIQSLPTKLIVKYHSRTLSRYCRSYCQLEKSIQTMSSPPSLISRIDDALSRDLKLCLITRGAPGRGKTTLIEQLVQHYGSNGEYNAIMVAADDFMVDANGDYCFAPEKLSGAHQSCRSRLVMAMEEGIEVVCQHNTNVCKWESQDLQVKAEALGYLVVFIEPKYAWARISEIPPTLRNVLVNSHGVPDDKIASMISRKETFLPRYLAYWFRTSNVIKCFTQAGVSEENLYRIIQQFSSAKGAVEQKNTDTPTTGGGKKIQAAKVAGKDDKLPSTAAIDSNDAVWNNLLPDMLHVTTDYLGSDMRILSRKDYQDLGDNVLSSSTMQIVAIFSDERGVGALVTYVGQADDGKSVETNRGGIKECNKLTPSSWIASNIIGREPFPRFEQYTKAIKLQEQLSNGTKPILPHITLTVPPAEQAMKIGAAVYDFQQLLLNMNKNENETTVVHADSFESDDALMFYPNTISIGGFRAVLFETPVLITGTFAYSYSVTTAPVKKVYIPGGKKQGHQRGYQKKRF